MAQPTLQVRLLGGFEASVDGVPVDRAAFERPSGLRLLKLILATPGHRVRREAAAELLWPEVDQERSSANLRKAIHFARRAFEGPAGGAVTGPSPIVVAEGEWLGLDPALDVDVDVDRVMTALAVVDGGPRAAGDREVAAALEVLARLDGTELLPEDPYDEWLIPLRERLAQRTLDGLLRGVEAARRDGNDALAVRLADQALAIDPADETAHRAAIELHLEAGRVHAARRQLQACEAALAAAYGVAPAPDLIALVKAASAGPRAAERIASPPIIGRRAELEAAEPALDKVAEGRLGAVLLRGGAGIGKTTVLRELLQSASGSGWRVIEGRGLEASPEMAFSEFGQAIAATLGDRVPEDWGEPARSAVLAVAPRLGGAPAVTFASDEALARGILDALARLAREMPTVVAIDDVQWLDATTIAVLRTALVALRERPVLLLVGLRDESDLVAGSVGDLVDELRRSGGVEIKVGPMGAREIRLLVERAVREPLTEDLAASITELSGGTPLFALELFRGERERGALELRSGRWRRRSDAPAIAIPESLRRLVERRTGALPAQVRTILAAAAELGDEVGYEELVIASGDQAGSILDALDAGMSAGLIEESGGRYRFSHPLFRSALRQAASLRDRPDLHLRIALALSRGIRPVDRPAIEAAAEAGADVLAVAHHARQAAELGRAEAIPLAVGFGLVAGERQAALFDFEGATTTLRRAVGLWYRLPEEDRGPYPAAMGQIQLGWARHGAGDETGAGQAFRSAAVIARSDAERAQAFTAAAWMPYQHGRFEQAEAVLRQGLAAVAEPVARASLEAELGWIAGRRGDWRRGLGLLAPAVATMEPSAPRHLFARALDRLGVATRNVLGAGDALPILERAVALAVDDRDARVEAMVRMHIAGNLRIAGALDEAMAELDRALEMSELSGDQYIESVSAWIAAEVEYARGRYANAVRFRRRELETLAAIGGNPLNQAMAHAHLAHLYARLGDADAARAEAEAARQAAAHSGMPGLPGRIELALAADDWFEGSAAAEGGNAAGTGRAEPSERA